MNSVQVNCSSFLSTMRKICSKKGTLILLLKFDLHFSSPIERKQDCRSGSHLSNNSQNPGGTCAASATRHVVLRASLALHSLTSPPTVFPRCSVNPSSPPSSSSSSNRKFNYQQRVSGHVRVIIRRITTSKRRLNGLLYGRVSPADSRSIGKKLGKIRIDSIIHLSFVLCLVFLLLGCRKKVEGKLVGFFIVTILNFVLKGRGEEKKWIRWMYSRLTIIVCIFS